MAVLTWDQRNELLGPMLAETDGTVSKDLLTRTIASADDWVDSNAVSYNAALPVAAQTALTVRQKDYLLKIVVEARYG